MLPTWSRPTGYFNFGDNTATLFDQWKKYSFNQDLAYFKKGFGTHNFKFGYAFNRGTNDILSGYNTAAMLCRIQYRVHSADDGQRTTIAPRSLCQHGLFGSSNGCQGNWGTVTSVNWYDRQSWRQQPCPVCAGCMDDRQGPTLNLGFVWTRNLFLLHRRFQRHQLRLGRQGCTASWRVLGPARQRQSEMYGSFGYFFDIMKYQLPRGTFGGDYWHDCVYALDNPDYPVPARATRLVTTARWAAEQRRPMARSRRQHSLHRERGLPSAVQRSADSAHWIYRTGRSEPETDEAARDGGWSRLGASSQLAFETRYSRKRLDRTIEDAGIITPNGEQFYIVNPGEGINATLPPLSARPARQTRRPIVIMMASSSG